MFFYVRVMELPNRELNSRLYHLFKIHTYLTRDKRKEFIVETDVPYYHSFTPLEHPKYPQKKPTDTPAKPNKKLLERNKHWPASYQTMIETWPTHPAMSSQITNYISPTQSFQMIYLYCHVPSLAIVQPFIYY